MQQTQKQIHREKPQVVKIPLGLIVYTLNGITYARSTTMGPLPQQAVIIKTLPIVKGG